jgi:hypothetical protein
MSSDIFTRHLMALCPLRTERYCSRENFPVRALKRLAKRNYKEPVAAACKRPSALFEREFEEIVGMGEVEGAVFIGEVRAD